MEGVSQATGSHRASFIAAYATLEQSIRKFSKEKQMYEQTIEGLKEQIRLTNESFQKLNLEHQELMAENRRRMTIHEENENTRQGVDALLASGERKQEIIKDAVEGFDKIEQDVFSRYEAHEEFLYCLKFRQMQLVQNCEAVRKQNETLRMALEDMQKNYEVEIYRLSEANSQIQEDSANFVGEKARLCNEYQEAIDKLKNDLVICDGNLQLEKTALKELETTLSNVQGNLETTLKELTEKKELMQQMMHNFAEEKESLLKSQRLAVNDLTKKLEEANISMEEKVSSLGEEKSKLISDHEEAVSKMLTDFQLKTEELQAEKERFEKIQGALIEIEGKYESTLLELTKTKDLMEEKMTTLEEEKAVLTNNHKQAVDELMKELTDLKILMEETSTSFTKGKSVLISQHEEAMEAVKMDLEVCKEELQMEKAGRHEVQINLDELKVKFDCTSKDLSDAKQEMIEKVSSHSKRKESLLTDHKKAMESLEQEYQNCKDELKAMHTRFAEQKKAISKLVDDTNSRPIILPFSKDPKRHPASQERLEPASPAVYRSICRSAPTTSARPRISSPAIFGVEFLKSRGILKRPSDTGITTDKNKNVSFGPTYVTHFHISFSSDTESSSGEIYHPSKDSNTGKRMKFSKDRRDKHANDDLEEPNDVEKQGKEKSGNRKRRFVRKNAAI